MVTTSAANVHALADRLLPEVVDDSRCLLHLRQAVWDADEHLPIEHRDGRADGTVSPQLAYWKGQRASALKIMAEAIGEVITNDASVLPWDMRFGVISHIVERLTSHD